MQKHIIDDNEIKTTYHPVLQCNHLIFPEFTEGAVVGITLGSVIMVALLCAVIAFSAFLYYKRMCPCISQQMFAPKPVEIHFNSYGKGPGARGPEAVSPWVSIMISNDKDKEVCLLFSLSTPSNLYLSLPSIYPPKTCSFLVTRQIAPHTPLGFSDSNPLPTPTKRLILASYTATITPRDTPPHSVSY